jgi:hypothetical protein
MRGIYLLEMDDDSTPEEDAASEGMEVSLHAITGIHTGSTMCLAVLAAGHAVTALVDSGSTHCFVAPATAQRLGWQPQPRQGMTVGVANGDRIPCSGLCSAAAIAIDQEAFHIDFYVVPLAGYEMVLGCHWLRTLSLVLWDFENLAMSFWRVDHRVQWRGLATPGPPRLHSASATDLLQLLLEDFADVFATPTSLPPSRPFDHRIHLLPGTAPIAVRLYRYPQLLKDEIERQCTDMLTQGLIRPSTSPFSSPVLLVKKKDATWRFCVDYRALNSKTVKDKFPIPVVEELLDELQGACYFTKLDLPSGYHQVRMHPEDIAKTAFRTHHGHFEFVVMAFGLTNAPSTFQALMNSVLCDFLRRFVLVFFDDILIYSTSWSEHLQHVCAVLTVLRQHHLAVKHSKCIFGSPTVAYLGHIISAKGVAMDPSKVEAVQAWPPLKTPRALRGFLGLTRYYRKFIRDYGTIARPLTQLLKKAAFAWSPEVAASFAALKQALTAGPVLQLPDFDKPFIVNCDASGSGFGAVLHQDAGPIAFYSRPLALQHAKLATYERELIGLVKAVRHWQPYLWTRSFLVRTDHYAFKFLLDQRLSTIPQHTWVSKLFGYDFSVDFHPGKTNTVADALSRRD